MPSWLDIAQAAQAAAIASGGTLSTRIDELVQLSQAGNQNAYDELLAISRSPWNYSLTGVNNHSVLGHVVNDNQNKKSLLDQLFNWSSLSDSDKTMYALLGVGIALALFMPRR
jgi:ABC-type phosphate/phosphonate transport system ATPase subunit